MNKETVSYPKHQFEKIGGPLFSLPHYLQRPRCGSNLCPLTDKWINGCGVYTQLACEKPILNDNSSKGKVSVPLD